MRLAQIHNTHQRGKVNAFQYKNIKEQERWQLQCKYIGKTFGHIVNIEKKDGKLQIFDAQNRVIIKGRQAIQNFVLYKNKMKILRIDNAEFNPQIIDFF